MTLDHITMIDDADPAHGAGEGEAGFGCLQTARGGLPLQRLAVDGRITGLLYRLAVTQTFVNIHAEPLEATYIFPLPARAGVTRFQLRIGERVIDGVLKERSAARADYDQAIRHGYRAAIAEEERPEVFTLRVGNLPPGETVTVELELAGPMAVSDGQATFRFPLVVAPRFIPGVPLAGPRVGLGTAPDTDVVCDGSRITPPILTPGQPNPVHLEFRLELDSANLLVSDPSACHALRLSQTSEGLPVIELTPGAERLDRDIIVRFTRIGEETVGGSLTVYRQTDDEMIASLTVAAPPARLPESFPPHDRVVLTDHCGAITVWNMGPTKGFGTNDIAAALTKAMDLFTAPSAAGDRILWLISDGQYGNEDQLLRQMAQQANCRIFTVAIGRAPNASLLERLATYGGGHCEWVQSLDELSHPLYCRLGAPLLTDLRLEPALEDAAPDPANLFPGVPLEIRGRFSGSVPAEATVTGRAPDGSIFRQTLRVVETADGALHTLWARARALDLEHRFVVDPDRDPGLADASTAFALNHGILSRFTAFVAVDHEAVNPDGELRQVVQDVETPLPWWVEASDSSPSQEMLSQAMSVRAAMPAIVIDTEESPAAPAVYAAAMVAALRAGLLKIEALGDAAAGLVAEGRDLIASLESGLLEELQPRLTDWLLQVRERMAQPADPDRRRFWWRDRG